MNNLITKASNCSKAISCSICKGVHATAIHAKLSGGPVFEWRGRVPEADSNFNRKAGDIRTACAQVCGNVNGGKSCAKVVCVNVYSRNNPEYKKKLYALLDDQSNRSLVKPEFVDVC